jgi:hypothetical protein
VEIHERARLRLREGEAGRWRCETIAGQEYWKQGGKWVEKTRTVDRQENRYTERVVDPQTGEVIHECDEPLDAHRDHGFAKPRRETT